MIFFYHKILLKVELCNREVRRMTEEEIRNRGIRCALRHMHSLRVQAAGGKKADFIEPCQQCGEFDACEADWSETTKLIMKESGYLDCD